MKVIPLIFLASIFFQSIGQTTINTQRNIKKFVLATPTNNQKYTYIFSESSDKSTIIDSLIYGMFFTTELIDSSEYLYISTFNNTNGFVKKNKIIELKQLKDSSLNSLIQKVYLTTEELLFLFQSSKGDSLSNDYFSRLSIWYYKNRFRPLLLISSDLIIHNKDLNLLKSYINIMELTTESVDELQSYVFAKLYYEFPKETKDYLDIKNSPQLRTYLSKSIQLFDNINKD